MSALENDKVVLGKVTAVHGLRGWLKVYSWTQPRENIFLYSRWWLKYPDARMENVVVEETRIQGKGLAVRIKGCHDRDFAQTYINAEILVNKESLPALKQGEFYWHQLEGMNVETRVNEQPVNIGKVDHIIDTGANDVLIVRPTTESVDNRERLIPWIDQEVILSVDMDLRLIQVNWEPDF